jgi:NADH-quinone oxidoreductase subunit L
MSDEQNVKKMGGLRRYLPVTFMTFIVGYLALSAIPPFSGWWSHEAVLEAAYHKNIGLWIVGVVVDGLTAYYMSREVVLVFLGKARWTDARPQPQAADIATDDAGAHGHHGEPADAPWTMTVPLIVLAVGALLGGLLDLPTFHMEYIDHWLAPIFPTSLVPAIHIATSTKWTIGLVGTAVNFVGLFAGLRLWRQHVNRPALEPAFLGHGWYLDEGIAAAVSGPLAAGADGLAYGVDVGLVDRTVNGVGTLVAATGRQLRRVQTGYVRNYALGIGLGAAVILVYVASRVGS